MRLCFKHRRAPEHRTRMRNPMPERSLLTIRRFEQGASRNSQKDVP